MRILVVGEPTADREVLSLFITGLGHKGVYEVVQVDDLEQACDMLVAQHFNILVLWDLEFFGARALAWIKHARGCEVESIRNMPILVFSHNEHARGPVGGLGAFFLGIPIVSHLVIEEVGMACSMAASSRRP